jgi:predicted SnoaL-like aldol condensation-catalyzing enzyme
MNATRKNAAVDFLQMVVRGEFDKAYGKHMAHGGVHHNPYFAAGFEALKQGMKDNHAQFPSKSIAVKSVIGEGDLVAVHSQVVLKPGTPGLAAVHIFRFKGDKVVELWDVAQEVPASSPNKDGMF